ncbi:MAG: DUF481 domain-containing protein [Endomicrobia bacterium]|nr:DUF481 domain-containing protein [Endomicrobiia bacterium]
MKKLLSLAFMVLLACTFSFAQDESGSKDEPVKVQTEQAEQSEQQAVSQAPVWRTSGILSWAYNQSAVSKNWTGSERFSRAWQMILFLSLERDSERSNWLTTFRDGFGKSDTEATSDVSLDYLEFSTVYIYRIYRFLQPYASLFIQTQNDKFWDPVTYIESAGLSFTMFENEINTLRLRAGGALRQIHDSVRGNEQDAGAEGVLNYSLLFHKDAKFVSEARVFESFDYGQDFRWDNKLFLKTGPWFTTEFGYRVFFEKARIAAHSWPNDIETMLYVALGLSFNMFQ